MSVRERGRPDRRVIVLSDIEMGAGGAVDDFPHSPWLGALLRRLAAAGDEPHLDIVFNGDTFDLLKTSHRGEWPVLISADIAVAKMARVADAHPAFFAALRELVSRRGGRTTVHFVAGNHDLELLFPEVRSLVRDLVATDERVCFHDHSFDLGRVHFEHGSQLDPLFRVEPELPFLDQAGAPILNLSWASVALLERLIPLQAHLGHHDRLKPKALVLALMPELRDYLADLAWGYWTGDWWRDFFEHRSPVKRLSWTMLKEVLWRTLSLDLELSMDEGPQRRCEQDERYDAYVLGHLHKSSWWSFGDRKVLRTGCLRDEYMVSDGGQTQTLINKSWAELFLRDERVVHSHLVEEVGPARAPETMPASIFDVLPWVREQLGPAESRSGARAAQALEESRERAEREANRR